MIQRRVFLASWTFPAALLAAFVGAPQAPAQIQTAGDLFVQLDAADPTAGTPVWTNTASESIGDFVVPLDPAGLVVYGQPIAEVIDGKKAVTFNLTDVQDAYQCENDAPDGLIGLDPTRSIEAWVFNPVVADEETILSWGKRGGPDGTNMSFNYGSNQFFGAVGHWGGAGPDIGWDNAGGAPAPGLWHYLAYTYDGETTRVYADGCVVDTSNCELNSEALGLGIINTFGPSKITLASQIEADGVTLTPTLRGTLSIGRVRIHDEVLTPEQIKHNYDFECPAYCPAPGSCKCDNCPLVEDFHLKGKTRYARQLKFSGFPAPTGLGVSQPLGATITAGGLLELNVPNPPPASFNVRVQCTNSQGTAEFAWKVTLVNAPVRSPNVEIAGELFVDLYASHSSAGSALWLNNGTLADFAEVGDPLPDSVGINGSPAVTFNEGATDDFYQCLEKPPAGLVGVDPTRTIEAWVFNPDFPTEETILSWGKRGGPAGTNMSFNYGSHPAFGAVGHWDAPDIGWNNPNGAPDAGVWHHLAYTYDGTTTRVYADGILANSEVLGAGIINTWPDPPITLAGQIEPDGLAINLPLKGSLSIGQVRVHDGVLSPSQVFKNFNAERDVYGAPPADVQPPAFTNAPASDTFCEKDTSYKFTLQVTGVPPPTLEIVQPAGATLAQTGILTYVIPQPPPASFTVEVKATNDVDTVSATWTVTKESIAAGIQVAEDLIVNLDVRDPTAGTDTWANNGSLGDFAKVGTPQITFKGLIRAMSFNENGRSGDAYQSIDDAPDGVVGPDPTRTIEVWAWNDQVADEETLLSWGHRGGPDGTNMSFNYGLNGAFGAVGHWGNPDIGWAAIPAAGTWHHLVYTYDGATTRVFDNGVQTNSEVLGPGVINTYNMTKITLGVQIVDATGTLDFGARMGTLALARVRVHDGVLSPCQVLSNYLAEKDEFVPPPCPQSGDPNYADTHATGLTVVETGRPIGATHVATATAVDDTGDPIFYTFTASNGVEPPRVVGPLTTNMGLLNLRGKPGPWTFTVTVTDRLDCGDLATDATAQFPPATTSPKFHRGDADDNGKLELTDAVRILGFLYLGKPSPTCIDAADADDNGKLELTDAVRILGFLYLGKPAPADPGPPPAACGVDPTPADGGTDLGCASYTNC